MGEPMKETQGIIEATEVIIKPESITLTDRQHDALTIQLSQIAQIDQQMASLNQQRQQHILQRDALLESIAAIAGITFQELIDGYVPSGKELVLHRG